MESHPEEDHHSEYQQQANDTLTGLSRRHLLDGFRVRLLLLLYRKHLRKGRFTQIIDTDAGDHGDTSHRKSEVIRIGLGVTQAILRPFHGFDRSRRSEQGTHVDQHVEQGEARITLIRILRIVVEVADHHLQVTFKHTGTHADQ